jgi:hypothetical protein
MSISWWMYKINTCLVGYHQTGEYYSAIKKNGVLPALNSKSSPTKKQNKKQETGVLMYTTM